MSSSSSSFSSSSEQEETLIALGFSQNKARVALARAGGDLNVAASLLSDPSFKEQNDEEFDFLPAVPEGPRVAEPTVFQPRTTREEPDLFLSDGSKTISEMVDSRISSLTAMGFTVPQAEEALRVSNNDINEALTWLLAQSDK